MTTINHTKWLLEIINNFKITFITFSQRPTEFFYLAFITFLSQSHNSFSHITYLSRHPKAHRLCCGCIPECNFVRFEDEVTRCYFRAVNSVRFAEHSRVFNISQNNATFRTVKTRLKGQVKNWKRVRNFNTRIAELVQQRSCNSYKMCTTVFFSNKH